MLPIERQKRIKELIKSKKNLKTSELSKELNVSEMTIHRDLKSLIEEGLVTKTFGGISLVEDEPANPSVANCVFCYQKIQERLAYRLILPNNIIETACCAHCGLLRHRQLGGEASQALCHDFLKHTTISAASTSFVFDTTLHIGCCQPQVLPFEMREDAEKFIQGFGGGIYPFQEALEVIFEKMQGNYSSCNQSSTFK